MMAPLHTLGEEVGGRGGLTIFQVSPGSRLQYVSYFPVSARLASNY